MNNLIIKKLRWLLLSILIMLLDLGTKLWVRTNFFIGEKIYILPGLNLYYVHNSGLAFGIFSKEVLQYRYSVILAIIFVIIIFTIMVCTQKLGMIWNLYNIAYLMIIGGALGNLCDRIFYGSVVDFIDIYVGCLHWPTFNIADVAICIGVSILIAKNYCFFKKN